MAFSRSLVSCVKVAADGPDLLVSWDSNAPDGTMFQLYVDRRLSWFGTSRSCHVPMPAESAARNVWVEVGTVEPGERSVDYSEVLSAPTGGAERVELTWHEEPCLGCDVGGGVTGFRIYRTMALGSPPRLVGDVPAHPNARIGGRFGLEGGGEEGGGSVARIYTWKSGTLPSGRWTFRVVPYDRAGVEAVGGREVSVGVTVPPRPPARLPHGDALAYAYEGPDTRRLRLSWLPSPSAL